MFVKHLGLCNIIAGLFLLFSCSSTKPIQKMENKPVIGSVPVVIPDSNTTDLFLPGNLFFATFLREIMVHLVTV